MAVIISGTTGIKNVDGTSGTPSETGTTSTTAGVFYPAANTVAIATSSLERLRIDASGNLGIGTISPIAPLDVSGNTNVSGTAVMGSSFKRNRIINGDMRISQRVAAASQTITAAAALAYTVDRWYAYCTGANATGQQIAGATANQYRYQFTGAASVTAIGFAQRIEALNSADLAGTTATLAVDMSNSVLTTVTWTAYYANTTNTFGTLASPTVTSIATGTFTVTSSIARYSVNISIPAAATTGIQILFTVGAQTSGTWVIGNVQLETGNVATPYERQIYTDEFLQCQRYYTKISVGAIGDVMCQGSNSSTTAARLFAQFPVPMRIAPTAIETSGTAADYSLLSIAAVTACSAVPSFSTATPYTATLTGTVASGLTNGLGVVLRAAATTAYVAWSAEL